MVFLCRAPDGHHARAASRVVRTPEGRLRRALRLAAQQRHEHLTRGRWARGSTSAERTGASAAADWHRRLHPTRADAAGSRVRPAESGAIQGRLDPASTGRPTEAPASSRRCVDIGIEDGSHSGRPSPWCPRVGCSAGGPPPESRDCPRSSTDAAPISVGSGPWDPAAARRARIRVGPGGLAGATVVHTQAAEGHATRRPFDLVSTGASSGIGLAVGKGRRGPRRQRRRPRTRRCAPRPRADVRPPVPAPPSTANAHLCWGSSARPRQPGGGSRQRRLSVTGNAAASIDRGCASWRSLREGPAGRLPSRAPPCPARGTALEDQGPYRGVSLVWRRRAEGDRHSCRQHPGGPEETRRRPRPNRWSDEPPVACSDRDRWDQALTARPRTLSRPESSDARRNR